MLQVACSLVLIDFFCENNANYIFQIRGNIEVATYCLVNPQQTLVTCLVKITLPNKKAGTANEKNCSTNSFKKNIPYKTPLFSKGLRTIGESMESYALGWPHYHWIKIRSSNIKLDKIRSNQIKTGQIRSNQVNSYQIISNYIKSHQITSDQIKSDQIESNT